MEYLFIGGIADGQRLSVPDGMSFFNVPDGMSDYDLYRREYLASPSQRYIVFIENTLNLDAAMQLLIDNYHPPQTL
jgi:hypothetical protein